MKLYFGNMVTTVTTLMIVSLVGFVGYSISNRSNINFWGRRSLFILAYSLVICCFAAARDGLDKTIQYTIDGSCNPGIFSLVSVPNIVGCIGAAIVLCRHEKTCKEKTLKNSFWIVWKYKWMTGDQTGRGQMKMNIHKNKMLWYNTKYCVRASYERNWNMGKDLKGKEKPNRKE